VEGERKRGHVGPGQKENPPGWPAGRRLGGSKEKTVIYRLGVSQTKIQGGGFLRLNGKTQREASDMAKGQNPWGVMGTNFRKMQAPCRNAVNRQEKNI